MEEGVATVSGNPLWYVLLVLSRWNKIRQILRVSLSYSFGNQYNNMCFLLILKLYQTSNDDVLVILYVLLLKSCIYPHMNMYVYHTYALSFYSGIQDAGDFVTPLVPILNVSKISLECLWYWRLNLATSVSQGEESVCQWQQWISSWCLLHP